MKELKKLQNALKDIHLSEQEKEAGRREFMSFMKKNPIELKAKPGLLASFYLRMRRPILASAMAFGLLVVSTGGITYASESALPGEFLYTFKVDVVEEVRGVFQFTPEDKAAWDAELIQRRVEEAKQLKNTGRLKPEFKFQIKEQMEQHKNEFQAHLNELKENGKEDRANEIELKFKPTFEEQENLKEEWKPAFEFKPLLEDTEAETETETEIETETELEIESETELEIESETELEIESETELEIENEITLPSEINLK